MGEKSCKTANNRRHSKTDRWCIIVTIVLAVAIVLCGAIAVGFALMFNADAKASANLMKQQQQTAVFRSRGNRTSSSAEMITADPEGNVPWQDFHGRWDLVKWSDNIDPYLIELQIPWMLRQIVDKVSLNIVFKVNGNVVKIQAFNSFNKQKEGEFHVNTPDETLVESQERTYRAKTIWEDGKLIVMFSQSLDGEVKPQTVTRQIINDNKEMVVTMEIGDVMAKQYFVRNADNN